jgi:Papain family cysteine protease
MPTIEHKGLLLDARPDRVDFRDLFYRAPLVSLAPEFPPASKVEHYLPKYCEDGMILDQRSEGACTGYGLAAVINYLYWERIQRLEGGPPPAKVSPHMLYHMARMYDEWDGEDYEGSSCRGAMKGWHHHGVCGGDLWGGRGRSKGRPMQPAAGWAEDAAARPLGAYYRINRDSLVDMQAAIHEVHAIYASATVHEGWWLEKQNSLSVIDVDGKGEVGGHAFAIVGYRDDGFIIQNSWGSRWGYRGFAVLTYPDWLQHGLDAWVAVLGAPVAVGSSPIALSRTALQDLPRRTRGTKVMLSGGRATFTYRSAEVVPWADDRAYEHSLILGNDGRPLHRLLEAATADDNLRLVAEAGPGAWLGAGRGRKLAVYAHGGLNDEEASIRRIRVLAPYFEANGIYPLFLTWRTGFAECLASLLEDSAKRLRIDLDLQRARGLFDEVGEAILEAMDRAFEAIAERALAKAVWIQIKQNAKAAAMRGGLGTLAGHLARLKQAHPELEIHLIGHSAGAILLGHLLDRLGVRRIGARSMTLFAPACSMAFASDHYGKAFSKGLLDPGTLTVELLSDELELKDSVGPYRKSLLYLVSRALEEVHKMPLLGLAAAWAPDAGRPDVFSPARKADIMGWLQNWGRQPTLRLVQDRQVFDGQGWINAAHGAFDNDVAVIGRTIERILGEAPRFKVENLRGF